MASRAGQKEDLGGARGKVSPGPARRSSTVTPVCRVNSASACFGLTLSNLNDTDLGFGAAGGRHSSPFARTHRVMVSATSGGRSRRNMRATPQELEPRTPERVDGAGT